ncbi:MAG: beta-ketoacyl-ACP synthase II [Bacteriovoracaceae bacterium]|nr:beta-ketoacyl-ACP synthase II [Bacteriovoracaceae bacterium]
MSQDKRIVITGMGTINGLGHDLSSVWGNVVEGKPGVSTIESFDTSIIPVKIAGEIKNFTIAEDLLTYKEAPRFDKFIHYALHAAKEAYVHSGLSEDKSVYKPERIGTILGVGMGGFPNIQETHSILLEKGVRRVSPFFVPAVVPNLSAGMIAIKLGFKGANFSVSSACASAGHAMSTAVAEILSGRHDVVITGGAECTMCTLAMSGFISMKALSRRNDEPKKASRPFDIDRDGFVMGEGAGIIVIETLEKAKARGATIYAELVGIGASDDAYHITAPHPEGDGAYQCMMQAIESAGISPEDVGYINAHGTATPLGDIAETKAIKKTFGDHAYNLQVSSTKSMTGHLLGAAGGIESIFSIMALHTGIIPPTINLDNQDPQCDLQYVPNKALKHQAEYSLNNSFGFGGTNSSLIFKRYS